MALNTNLGNSTYSPQGASTVSGARAGSFTLPTNPVSPGIPIGNVYGTYLNLYQPFTELTLLTVAVPANSTMYVPFTTNEFSFPDNTTLVAGQYIEFDWSRDIIISGDQTNFEAFISGYDLYDEKVTWGASETLVTRLISTRTFKKVTAIQLTNNADTETNFNIILGTSIELPYYNFGASEHLLLVNFSISNSSVNYTLNGIISPSAPSEESQNVPLTWGFTITNPQSDPLNPQLTLSTGIVRPIIEFDPDLFTYDNANVDMFIKQAVFGYGTLPDWVVDNRSTLINNKISIIGASNYNTDWVAFQG